MDPAGVAALLLAAVAAVGAWFLKHRTATVEASRRTIAVLPLQNIITMRKASFCGSRWPTRFQMR